MLPGRERVLLIAVHFSSKMYDGGDNQTLEMPLFNVRIRMAENKVEHRRTVIVGDFNMNPFDAGVVARKDSTRSCPKESQFGKIGP